MKMSPGCNCCGLQATVSGTANSTCLTGAGVHYLIDHALITVKDSTLTTTFGTLLANTSGVFSGPITIPSSPITAKVLASADVSATWASRYGVSSAVTVTLTANATTSVGFISVPPATGFHCLTDFPYPIPDVLHLTDSIQGSFTLNWSVANTWTYGQNFNYPACGAFSCGAVSGVPCTYTMTAHAIQFGYRTAFGCPTTSGSSNTQVTLSVSPTSNPFNMTGSIPTNNAWFCNGGAGTWTITE